MERLERAKTPGCRERPLEMAFSPNTNAGLDERPASYPVQPPTGANEAALLHDRPPISSGPPVQAGVWVTPPATAVWGPCPWLPPGG